MLKRLCLAAACAALWGAPALAQTPEQEALWSNPNALRAALAQDADDLLARGLLAGYELRDAEAEAALTAVLNGGAVQPAERRRALSALAGLRLRQGRYREAAEVLEQLLPLSEAEDERRGAAQSLAVARLLADTPAQTRTAFRPGAVLIERDAARLARIPVGVNGRGRRFVLDTGANFSVVTESEAAALGLRILGETAGIGSITQDSAASHIGVADEVTIGDVVFRNVVFLVMPDASLTFAGGAYSIPGIVGFPVISQLERLEVGPAPDGGEQMGWGPSGRAPAERDLFVDGLTPRVYVRVAGGPPSPFAFDTGANRTTLRPALLAERPELAAEAVETTEQVGGAGGTQTVSARRTPQVTLQIDEAKRTLSNVSVADEKAGGEAIRGRLGQDVLAQGYVMDFPAGDFQLKTAP